MTSYRAGLPCSRIGRWRSVNTIDQTERGAAVYTYVADTIHINELAALLLLLLLLLLLCAKHLSAAASDCYSARYKPVLALSCQCSLAVLHSCC